MWCLLLLHVVWTTAHCPTFQEDCVAMSWMKHWVLEIYHAWCHLKGSLHYLQPTIAFELSHRSQWLQSRCSSMSTRMTTQMPIPSCSFCLAFVPKSVLKPRRRLYGWQTNGLGHGPPGAVMALAFECAASTVSCMLSGSSPSDPSYLALARHVPELARASFAAVASAHVLETLYPPAARTLLAVCQAWREVSWGTKIQGRLVCGIQVMQAVVRVRTPRCQAKSCAT